LTASLVQLAADGTVSAPHDRKIDFRNHRELLEANLLRQIEASRAADLKIALLVPTTTAMLGVLAAMLRNKVLTPQETLIVCLCAAPLLLAFALMAGGVIPRLRFNRSRSLLFFGDLATHEEAGAQTALLALTSHTYLADLAAQCHTTARIAQTKHSSVRRAYLAFLIAQPFWLVAIWVLNLRQGG
jgi:Family of unknown function (DUF5706)